MKVIGLTGGIASGKSTISNLFKDLDIPVIDGDKIARDVLINNTSMLDRIVSVFGNQILNSDGSLNRKLLGNIVFNSNQMLEALNTIMHPEIRSAILDKIEYHRVKGEKCCVVDAALLMEGVFIGFFDILIIVYVSKDMQLKRLIEREHIGTGEALSRIKSQMPFEEKRKFADYIIDNSFDLEYTKVQFNRIIKEILLSED